MSARTEVLEALTRAGFPLDYESLSIRTGYPEPSVRVATRQLQIAGQVRVAQEGNGTSYSRKTWVPVGPAPVASATI